jgi:hypothetical protein
VSLAILCAVTSMTFGCRNEDDQITTAPLSNRTLPARSHYVATNGSASGNGTITSPWDIVTAFNHPNGVFPNDTIWLRGGSYQGDIVSNLVGQSGKPIVVRQYPGERATIDGKFTIMGNYAYYWGFEVMYSDTKRITAQIGPDPTDLPRNDKSLTVVGQYTKLINMVVHDMGDGVFTSTNSSGAEIYGSIVYNNGWQGPDHGYGHNLYMQNQGATKRVVDNIVFNSFSMNLHIYGSEQAVLRNFHIEGNTIFGAGEPMTTIFGNSRNVLQWGGGTGMFGGFVYLRNSIYHREGSEGSLQMNGAGYLPGDNLSFTNNMVQGQSHFAEWQNYTITNNMFTAGTTPLSGQNMLVSLRFAPGQSPSAHVWNNNSYFAPSTSTQLPFEVVGAGIDGNYYFPQWKTSTHYDANSTYTSGTPTTSVIVVRPNQYESGRANITVWNWSGMTNASVDVSSVLTAGQSFAVRHAYNVYGPPIASGVYSGSPISIPLSGHTPPRPIGLSITPPSTGTKFNAFILTRN